MDLKRQIPGFEVGEDRFDWSMLEQLVHSVMLCQVPGQPTRCSARLSGGGLVWLRSTQSGHAGG